MNIVKPFFLLSLFLIIATESFATEKNVKIFFGHENGETIDYIKRTEIKEIIYFSYCDTATNKCMPLGPEEGVNRHILNQIQWDLRLNTFVGMVLAIPANLLADKVASRIFGSKKWIFNYSLAFGELYALFKAESKLNPRTNWVIANLVIDNFENGEGVMHSTKSLSIILDQVLYH